MRLRHECHRVAAPGANGHLRWRRRGAQGPGPPEIAICRRRCSDWRPIRDAADFRRAVVQTLTAADHASGEAEQDGRRDGRRRHVTGADLGVMPKDFGGCFLCLGERFGNVTKFLHLEAVCSLLASRGGLRGELLPVSTKATTPHAVFSFRSVVHELISRSTSATPWSTRSSNKSAFKLATFPFRGPRRGRSRSVTWLVTSANARFLPGSEPSGSVPKPPTPKLLRRRTVLDSPRVSFAVGMTEPGPGPLPFRVPLDLPPARDSDWNMKNVRPRA